MSRFQFRAWDELSKIIISNEELIRRDFNLLRCWNKFVKMQYTGLKDKNGVKIFEGDVVKHSVHNVVVPITKQILFWEGSFIAKPHYDGSQSYMSLVNFAPCRTMEVIGNIYENPELLEG